MKQFDPIEFTVPSGDTKRPRRLLKGSGGGDGGAAARKAAEDARIAQAVKKLNAIFAVGQFDPVAVDKNAFMQEVPQQNTGGIYGVRQVQPVKVPDGYTLVTKQNPRTPVIGMSALSGIGGLNGGSTSTQYLFNKAGYDKAVADAQAEADRKNKEAQASREGLYSKIGEDTTNNALVDLNKDRSITERDLGFMLARQGLSGGSRDVDVNRDILDTYQQGVLKASNMGTQASNDARSADDQTRVKLIQSIQAGLDEGSAMQQAYEGMRNNARASQDQANMATLSGFFDTLINQQKNAAYSDGYAQTVNPYQRTFTSAASPAVGGDRGKTNSY